MTYHPTLDEARTLADQGNLLPIYRILPADLETPVSVYMKLRNGGSSFLLESVEREQLGRYSFLGVHPARTLVARKGDVQVVGAGNTVLETIKNREPLAAVEELLHQYRPIALPDLPIFTGGAVGYLGYDAVRFYERLPQTASDDLYLPDAVFMLAEQLVIFDHVRHRLIVLVNARLQGDLTAVYADAVAKIERVVEKLRQPLSSPPLEAVESAGEWRSNFTQAQYEAAVLQAKEYIAAGDTFQLQLGQRLSRRTQADPFTIYRALRMLNPSPYMFYLELPDQLRLIGSSPEVQVRYEEGIAQIRPLAGTRWRGKTPAEDAALAAELLADPKERAEHVMLVDLARNDLGRVSQYGTVQVPVMMAIEKYSHVMHIVSHVQGRLRSEMNAFDVQRACFPAGTLTGAPKVRSMEIIEELEGTRRGVYGGMVGHFGYNGNSDTCIAIRTLVMKGDTCYLQAAAGIVADSDPAYEYRETVNKLRALVVAVEHAEAGLVG